MTRRDVLVCRLDSAGDVLVCGPAIRAVAAGADRVTVLAGPAGAAAARLLPGVDEVLVWRCPWIEADPPPVTAPDTWALVARLAGRGCTDAVVLTSYHQSALPLALLLRQAGIDRITAVSADYAGALLDTRVAPSYVDGLAEPERQLRTVAAAGFPLPAGDDGRLAVRRPLPAVAGLPDRPYLVVHPGAAAPARQPSPGWYARTVAALSATGRPVLVTGAPGEEDLTAAVAAAGGIDAGGSTSLAELAGVLAGAAVLVCGNTGPAHLAAAVGTPVVSLFAPVVPADWWAPYGVPVVLLGDQHAPCRGTRARVCPVPGHPCLDGIDPAEVVEAVAKLAEAERCGC
jgi:ADP-heptose:LPS heptosyltransferase